MGQDFIYKYEFNFGVGDLGDFRKIGALRLVLIGLVWGGGAWMVGGLVNVCGTSDI